MLEIIKTFYALKALISLHKNLRKFGWKRTKGHLRFKGYDSYIRTIGHRIFLVKVPKNIFSETFKDEIQKCLRDVYRTLMYKNIRENLIEGFIELSEKDGYLDKKFEECLKNHPFNPDDFAKRETNKGKE